MILREATDIAAPAARIYGFFDEMHDNYTRWHRGHIVFRWQQEGRLAVGNRFYFEERIDGNHIKRTVRVTRLKPDRLIEFAPDSALIRFFLRRVTFSIVQQDGHCAFTQEIAIRIGPIGAALNRKGLDAVRKHMREEGENLKAIVERPAGKAPHRTGQ